MERTKGKLEKEYNYLTDSQGKVVATTAHANGLSTEQQLLNAKHFWDCWNAFEPGGLVGELVGACEDAKDTLNLCQLIDKSGQAGRSAYRLEQVLAKVKEAL